MSPAINPERQIDATAPPTQELARLASELSLQWVEDPHGLQSIPLELPADAAGRAPAASEAVDGGAVALLSDWGVVAFRGRDAVAFINAQSTNDVLGQSSQTMRWHGFCTPTGRLLGGGPLWHQPMQAEPCLHLAVARQRTAPLVKRLTMYVLRSRLKVRDASDEYALLGLSGPAASAALGRIGLEAPGPGQVTSTPATAATATTPTATAAAAATAATPTAAAAAGTASSSDSAGIDDSVLVAIGLTGAHRYWLQVPRTRLIAIWSTLVETLEPIGSAAWRSTEILAGEPRIVEATSEAYVPQTINWDLIGAVSFRKGCYPGQEVVARLHYRGKPKRRMFAASLAGAPPAPGTDLIDAVSGQPAGSVISSAPAQAEPESGPAHAKPEAPPTRTSWILYEGPVDAQARARLRGANGQMLTALPMPYSIPADGVDD